MTESLFETNFTEPKPTSQPEQIPESQHDQSEQLHDQTNSNQDEGALNDDLSYDQSTTLPSLADKSNIDALINYRVLVSAKEAGCLIGQNGQVIDSIRGETNTKAGISKLVPGTHERILTVSGKLDDCSKALSFFAQALCNSNIETYNYFPLKQLSSQPCIENKTTIIRLMIPNSQMGTLIGSKGARIQQIQNKFGISMIASKSFLPGSKERLVELQGTVNDLYDSLRIISRCLIEDFSSIVNTTYYVPRSHYSNQYSYNATSSSSTSLSPSSSNNSAAAAAGNNNGFRKNTASISFPNDMVGALIGKNGSRIQGVRKISGANIGISDPVEGKNERIFTITGSPQSIEKAKNLLYHNMEREEQRRLEQEQQ